MADPVSNPVEFLKNELQRPAEESKKWKMAIIGLRGVAAFFLVGVLFAGVFPAAAAGVLQLVSVSTAAWGAIIAVFIGAQGTQDYATTTAISTTVQAQTVASANIAGK
jgi:hypothetical protein